MGNCTSGVAVLGMLYWIKNALQSKSFSLNETAIPVKYNVK